LVFYEKFNDLRKDKNGNLRKIKRVEGEIKEIDKPDWKRTRDILYTTFFILLPAKI
jgi:hypothetical protein